MERIEDGSLNGNTVMRHREFFIDQFGRPVLDRALARLPPDDREAIVRAKPTGWVPVPTMQALYDAVAAETNRDATELHYEMAAKVTDRNLRTIWRMVLRLTSDQQMIGQAPIVYSRTWNRGIFSAKLVRPGVAELRISSWPDVPDFTIRGVRVAVERSLTLAGRDRVEVTPEREPDGAFFRATWSP